MTKPGTDSLFGRAREAIIGLLFARDGVELHGRDIAKRARMSAAAVAAELQNLAAMGVVTIRPLGKVILYQANRDYPLYPELRGIAVKTWGIRGRIAEATEGVKDLFCAFIFGSVARGEHHAKSDIDVMAIGTARFDELAMIGETLSAELGRNVNIKLYRPDEWHRKAGSGAPFFADVMSNPKIFIKGDEILLHAITQSGKPALARAPGEARTSSGRNTQSPRHGERTAANGPSRRRP